MLPLSTAGALLLTSDTSGAIYGAGLFRRPSDQALLATTSLVGATWQNGLLRSPTGALVYNVGGAAASQHGLGAIAADGSLCTTASDPGGFLQHGLKHDASGRLYAIDAGTSPDHIAGVNGWWQADTAATPANDGVLIASWPDLSGNARHLTASGAGRPSYRANQVNGHAALRFSSNTMRTAAFASPTAGTSLFVVCKPTLIDTNFRLLAGHAGAGTWAAPFATVALQQNSPDNFIRGWVDDAGVGANIVSDTGAVTSVWQTLELTYDQTNIILLRNSGIAAFVPRVGVLTSRNFPFVVGGDIDGAQLFGGDIAEIVYAGSVDTSTRQSIEKFLAARHGFG